MAKVLVNSSGSGGLNSSSRRGIGHPVSSDHHQIFSSSPPRLSGTICAASRSQNHQNNQSATQQQQQGIGGGLNFYTTLGLRPGSSKQDVKQAYRKLALKYHPDVCNGDHCAPKFKQINAAYEGLRGNLGYSSNYYNEDSDDEEDEEWQGGWEGAWMF